jgi:RNA polymerase sigma-70 factor, ECF subfamily
MEETDITALLSEWAGGDQTALARLAPLVYPDLHALANSFFRKERPDHTLQPTALVGEVFMKLMARRKLTFENRRHFYALSARLMRYALIDHARTAGAEKRGQQIQFVPLSEEIPWLNSSSQEITDLDRALDELALLDPAQVEMLEMRYLMGCTVQETAEIMGSSPSTVDRKVRLARACYRTVTLPSTDQPEFAPPVVCAPA